MPLYKHKKLWWLLWILFSFGLSGYYANALVGANKHRFLPGKTSSGHYQIEQQCNVCHSPFGRDQALQQACVKQWRILIQRVNSPIPAMPIEWLFWMHGYVLPVIKNIART